MSILLCSIGRRAQVIVCGDELKHVILVICVACHVIWNRKHLNTYDVYTNISIVLCVSRFLTPYKLLGKHWLVGCGGTLSCRKHSIRTVYVQYTYSIRTVYVVNYYSIRTPSIIEGVCSRICLPYIVIEYVYCSFL